MERDTLHTPDKRTRALGWRALFPIGVYSVSVLALSALAWTLHSAFDSPNTWAAGAGLLLIHALLAAGLERMLSLTRLERAWRYRSGFLLSAGLAFIHWSLALALNRPDSALPLASVSWGMLPSAAFGAFAGSLVNSGLREGFWENNSPPTAAIEREVYERHRTIIRESLPEPWSKRSFDLLLALAGLGLSSPLWGITVLIVWLEDPGPVLFVKNSVGKGGKNFHQFKFRTMVQGAETHTGPISAPRQDQRVLRIGHFLRKTALDELPQLVNILKGEMSFVGPRPQRTVLVRDYLRALPAYAERHRVLPGLSGLAQVAGDYYLTPHQKLRFDRLYIRHRGLGFDLKLLLLAFAITFWYRWQSGWNGRLPRRLLRLGSHSYHPGPASRP